MLNRQLNHVEDPPKRTADDWAEFHALAREAFEGQRLASRPTA
jgi:hypothetical protein